MSLTLKVLTTYLVLCLIVFVIQRSLIYAPSRARSLAAVEAPFGSGRCHDIRCRTADGLQLNGWLVLREGQAAHGPQVAKSLADGTPVILYFGGNGGHRLRRSLPVETLASVGAHVVIFDHRGYGENPGQPSEKHLAADARSIWDRLTQKLGVAPERIVIYGESLGGGVAVRLASELCRDGQPPGGLIVQSTFSSLADAGSELYWFLPVRWLLVDRYESARHIPFVSCPIFCSCTGETIESCRCASDIGCSRPLRQNRPAARRSVSSSSNTPTITMSTTSNAVLLRLSCRSF